MALGSGLCTAAFQLAHREAHVGARSADVALLGAALATIVGWIAVAVIGPQLASLGATRWIAGAPDFGTRGWSVAALVGAAPAFLAGGILNFNLAFRFMKYAQRHIGAGRTAGLLATTPVFSAIAALVVLGEPLTLPMVAGILLSVIGAYVVAADRAANRAAGAARVALPATAALLSALCFALNPVVIKIGLARVPDPALAMLVGLAGALLIEIVAHRAERTAARFPSKRHLRFEILAGVAFAFGAMMRYGALQFLAVATVMTAVRISVPLVLVVERRSTIATWVGAAMIVAAAFLVA